MPRARREPAEEAWLKERLRAAVTRAGSADALGRLIGHMNGGAIRQCLSTRPVSLEIQDRISRIDGMHDWFRRASGVTTQVQKEGIPKVSSQSERVAAPFTLLPVVQFQGSVMSERNDALTVAGVNWITAPGEFSEFAKYMAMPDDSMAPEIYPGEYVCFDPAVAPDTGDVVMLADQHGGLWVRRYRPLPAGRFDAVPANDSHAPLRSVEDGLKVLAVMVGHWRGRRARRH